jgi:hypothetical protein
MSLHQGTPLECEICVHLAANGCLHERKQTGCADEVCTKRIGVTLFVDSLRWGYR